MIKMKIVDGILLSLVAIPIGFLVFLFYRDTWGEGAAQARAHAAFIQDCAHKGGTPLPTERTSFKGADRYDGWVCAKLEVIR